MNYNHEQMPAIDLEEWGQWQDLASSTGNPFGVYTPDRISELYDRLNTKLSDNPTELLLAFLEPEILRAIQSPDQRQLTPAEIAEVRKAIETYQDADLQYDASEQSYLSYLEKKTCINRSSPDIVKAFNDGNNEKVIAHTALAYQHLTERESHVIPLNDLPPIIAHAIKLYELELKPWWDFATKEDYSSKSEHDVTQKTSAPLYRDKDCPTIKEFFGKVIPKIMEIREKDHHAALKIFPQSKIVEAFNWRISKDKDGNVVWTFEWYPGAYTPREGEDGHLTVVKNHKLSKEERVVRAIVKFDSEGNPLVGLKSQKDADGHDRPFSLPQDTVNIEELFMHGEVLGNGGGDTFPNNNPFTFIKYLAESPRIKELIENFETVHAQFGYADMVVSGMIGPKTVFFMDIDIETPKHEKSDASYIKACLKKTRKFAPNFTNKDMYSKLPSAPILHEFELQTISQFDASFPEKLYSLFKMASDGYTDQQLLRDVINELELTDDDFRLSFFGLSRRKSYLNAILTRREYEILKSMRQHRKAPVEETTNKVTVKAKSNVAKARAEAQQSSSRDDRRSPLGTITPTEVDVDRSRRARPIPPKSLVLTTKTVAEL